MGIGGLESLDHHQLHLLKKLFFIFSFILSRDSNNIDSKPIYHSADNTSGVLSGDEDLQNSEQQLKQIPLLIVEAWPIDQ